MAVATINMLTGLATAGRSGITVITAMAKVGTNGSQQDVTNSPQIKWISSIPTIASVSLSGLAKGLSGGSKTITAELTNPDLILVSATATITVSQTPAQEPLLSLVLIPNALSVSDLQGTGQFLAIGTFSTAPYSRDLTNSPGMTGISFFPDSGTREQAEQEKADLANYLRESMKLELSIEWSLAKAM